MGIILCQLTKYGLFQSRDNTWLKGLVWYVAITCIFATSWLWYRMWEAVGHVSRWLVPRAEITHVIQLVVVRLHVGLQRGALLIFLFPEFRLVPHPSI